MALITETGLLMVVLIENVLHLFCGVERCLNIRVDNGSLLMLVSFAVLFSVATMVKRHCSDAVFLRGS